MSPFAPSSASSNRKHTHHRAARPGLESLDRRELLSTLSVASVVHKSPAVPAHISAVQSADVIVPKGTYPFSIVPSGVTASDQISNGGRTHVSLAAEAGLAPAHVAALVRQATAPAHTGRDEPAQNIHLSRSVHGSYQLTGVAPAAAKTGNTAVTAAMQLTDVSMGAATSGDLTVRVAKDSDGYVDYSYWHLGQGEGYWHWIGPGGQTDAAPAAALVGGNYLFVVIKGLDGNLYLNQGELDHGFVGWLPLGASTDVAPAAASSGNTSVAVIKGLDGQIYYNYWQLGGGGSGWISLGGQTNAAPAAALVSGNYLFVFIRGLDGNVYVNQGELGKPFVGWLPTDDPWFPIIF